MSQDARTRTLLEKLAGRDDVLDHLVGGRVALVLGSKALKQEQGQLCAVLAANLLARLHPVVATLDICIPTDRNMKACLPRWGARRLARTIKQMLSSLDPPVRWRVRRDLPPPSEYDLALVVGEGDHHEKAIYIGSDGWIATFSPGQPCVIGAKVNPVGAYTAAILGVAEVWKRLLVRDVDLFPTPILPTTEDLVFSTFDYTLSADGPNPPLPPRIDLRNLTFAGLGAGGMATLFTLASVKEIYGRVTLIEPDHISETNLNRLVAAGLADFLGKMLKVSLGQALLAGHPGVDVTSHALPVDSVLNALQPEQRQNVVCAVHSRAARRTVQYETPAIVWDAGATETGDFWLWRVDFGRTRCMGCRFPDGASDPERIMAQQLADVVGLSEGVWYDKVRDNAPFTADEIEAIRATVAEGEEAPAWGLPEAGQPFGDWEAQQCGRLNLPEAGDDEIPIPFAPVMAGVLVAGEVLKETLFPGAALHGHYWNNLVGRFIPSNTPCRPAPRVDCQICADPLMVSQYRRRWGSQSAG